MSDFDKWLRETCRPENQRGDPNRTNDDYIMSIWGNPRMREHARTIFEAGADAVVAEREELRAEVREECAKIADQYAHETVKAIKMAKGAGDGHSVLTGLASTKKAAENIAAAIRKGTDQ
jgi:hypothetical protein